MEQQELLAVVAGVVLLLLLLAAGAAAVLYKPAKLEAEQIEAPEAGEARGLRPRGAARLAAGARRRRQLAAREAAESESSADEDEEGGEEADERQGGARAARRAAHQAQRDALNARTARRDAYDEKRRKKDEEREAQERAAEEDAARAEAEQQAAQDAEAAKWMGQISVEQEGTDASTSEDTQGLLQAFVDYIKERKTVVLEDLAADFGLRVQDVISRVQSLESMGRITGVMDDRGKFIYISMEEMEAVANFIKQRGRIAISELAAKSNMFIDLEAKAIAGPIGPDVDLDLGLDDDPVPTA